MTLLRAQGATFASAAGDAVGPFDLAIGAGDLATLALPTPRAAAIAARMCAGIVTPTSGTVYVVDFDTRLQPPAAKRRVGFVDAEGWRGSAHDFACELAFRAEVWNLDIASVRTRAGASLARLRDPGTPYARALALALVTQPQLVVLDRPPDEALVAAAHALVPHAALVALYARAAA